MTNKQIPLLGIVAYSGTGKTTLLKLLIPYLRQHGIRTGLIKHTHHDVDVDTPGKDSFELRKAGADQTMVASNSRWALMTETPGHGELSLEYLATRFDSSNLDMILVEGFKHEAINKIVLHRKETGKSLDNLIDVSVVAVATDGLFDPVKPGISILNINEVDKVGEFVIQWLKSQQN
ncbi:molybdopterin-guanine dinucleotide biosynthesis protein MobB [Rahnella bruchi]|uniref:molybdopterin-guanine dinucleotide biosynthesis protein MobB n=1 Tax=Rahnella bruchi TaxID=1510573 RepID=UPI000EA10250|nr:molybdopterin-guanine dinucleotide biosynthesis protein MobB [Rahnella bruchi]